MRRFISAPLAALLCCTLGAPLSALGPSAVEIFVQKKVTEAPINTVPIGLDIEVAASAQSDGQPVFEHIVVFGSNDGAVRALNLEAPDEVPREAVPTPVPRYLFQTGGSVTASPVTFCGLIYIGSQDGSLYALDPGTGLPRWVFDTGGAIRARASTLELMGDTIVPLVFVTSDDGFVYALDADTGIEKWRFDTGAPLQVEPAIVRVVVDEGAEVPAVIVGNLRGRVFSLNAEDGALNWTTDIDGRVLLSPTSEQPFADCVVVTDGGRRVIALDIATGGFVADFLSDTQVLSQPALCTEEITEEDVEAAIFFGAAGGTVYKVDLGCTFVWRRDGLPDLYGAVFPTEDDPRIYVGEGAFTALEFETGEISWEQPLASPAFVPGLIQEDELTGGTQDGSFIIVR